MSSNFRCENPKHGKVFVPEALVRTEMEEVEEKLRSVEERQRRQEELARLHEDTHIEKDMFRDANIESVALDPAKQEKMIQEYNRSGENKQQQGSISRPKVPANSHLHRPLSQDTRPSGNNPEAPLSTTHRPKYHVYDTLPDKPPSSSLGHHSASAGNILSHQNSQPGNIQSGEDAMLRKANVNTYEQGQEERLKEFKRQREEKREVARVVNPFGSCVDPPDNYHPENRLPPIYDNMPGAGMKQLNTNHIYDTHPDKQLSSLGHHPVNPQHPGAQQYQNTQYQAQPSSQEFDPYPNNIHPPPNNQAHGHPPHRDTPGEHHRNTPPQVNVPQEYNASVGSSNPYNLTVGSYVQLASINPNDPPRYGVIRWTGRIAGVDGQVAGMELVSIIIMPCAHTQARYTVCVCVCVHVCVCVCMCVCVYSASKSFYRLLIMFSWIPIHGFAK